MTAFLGTLEAPVVANLPGSGAAGRIIATSAGLYTWIGAGWVGLSNNLVTKSDVGLANVDNTADSAKPVSSAQQTAIDGRAPKGLINASGLTSSTSRLIGRTTTGTGVVEELTATAARTFLSINNVSNTSDANKPVSTAQQTAIDARAPKGAITASGLTATALTIAGRKTNSDGAIELYTPAELAAALPLYSQSTRGLVPPTGAAPSGRLLSDDGWVAPASGGGSDISSFAYFAGNGNWPSGQTLAGNDFVTIPISATVDPSGGWDDTNKWWTVPSGQSGFYEVTGSYRLIDGYPVGNSRGIGMDVGNIDSPGFFWSTTLDAPSSGVRRDGISFTRFMQLSAGDKMRLFMYADGFNPRLVFAAIAIVRLR